MLRPHQESLLGSGGEKLIGFGAKTKSQELRRLWERQAEGLGGLPVACVSVCLSPGGAGVGGASRWPRPATEATCWVSGSSPGAQRPVQRSGLDGRAGVCLGDPVVGVGAAPGEAGQEPLLPPPRPDRSPGWTAAHPGGLSEASLLLAHPSPIMRPRLHLGSCLNVSAHWPSDTGQLRAPLWP